VAEAGVVVSGMRPLCGRMKSGCIVVTATEIESGAHDGSANPTVFSVVVRSHVREVLHASVQLKIRVKNMLLVHTIRRISCEFSSIMGTLTDIN